MAAPVSEEAKKFLELAAQARAAGSKPYYEMTVDEARQKSLGTAACFSGEKLPVHKTENATIPVEGGELAIRIYQNQESVSGLPVLCYFHGGGFVVGSIENVDAVCRRMCLESDIVIINVQYRHAPEFPYPGPVNDCIQAAEWAVQWAVQHGAGVIGVAGDSAGGNLSAVVAQTLLDKIDFQILVYPCTDMTQSLPSHQTYGKGYVLDTEAINWFYQHYFQQKDHLLRDPRLSPLYAPDDVFKKLPPALTLVAECDPLYDECFAYAEKMRVGGVQSEIDVLKGSLHGCFALCEAYPEACKVSMAAIKRFIASVRNNTPRRK